MKVLNLSEFGISTEKLSYISEITHNNMKRSQLHGNEILYSMAGTIGIAVNYNKKFPEANINQAIAKIQLYNIENNKLFVYLLNSYICKRQAERFLTVAAQPNINFEQIASIKIPKLSESQKNKIIKTMDKAYQNKAQKEKEVKALIDSIDHYLFKKLNINILHVENNIIKILSCSDLFYDRIDPFYYQQGYQDIYSSIQKTNHCEIGHIAFVQGGKRIPKDKNFSHEKTSFKYFRVTDINSKKNIDDLKSIDEDLFSFLERYEVKDNNIILSNAGTIGKIQLFKNTSKNRVILTENAVKIIVNDDSIDNEYLSIVLNSSLLQKQMEREFIQTTIPKLSIDRIKKLLIPLPENLDEQKIIVEHITAIKDEAKQLKSEAKLTLEAAKKEVEKIILGEK